MSSIIEDPPGLEENKKDEVTTSITFKKRSRRGNQRSTTTTESAPETDSSATGEKSQEKTKNVAEEDDEDSVDWSTLDEYRALKQAKRRQAGKGINILELMSLEASEQSKSKSKSESTKTDKREGGLTDARTALAAELDLGNTFSQETNRRDEDAELMKYVEEELSKRKQGASKSSYESSEANKLKLTLSSDELMLAVIPEHLLAAGVPVNSEAAKEKTEEMLSSQMLSGIPEIDLGIEERIRNIESTDAARTKLLQERLKLLKQMDRARQEDQTTNGIVSSLVPSNLASCFNRNNIAHQAANAVNHRFNLNPTDLHPSSATDSTSGEVMEHFRNKVEQAVSRRGNNRANNFQHRKVEYDIEPVVVLGDEPQKIRLPKPMERGDKRMPGKDKPQDDYIFEKFRKQLRKH